MQKRLEKKKNPVVYVKKEITDPMMEKLFKQSEKVIKEYDSQYGPQANEALLVKISTHIKLREDKIFATFVEGNLRVFEQMWKYACLLEPQNKTQIQQELIRRREKVQDDIQIDKLVIDHKVIPKQAQEFLSKDFRTSPPFKRLQETKIKQYQTNITGEAQTLEESKNKMFDSQKVGDKNKYALNFVSEKRIEHQERIKRIEARKIREKEQESRKKRRYQEEQNKLALLRNEESSRRHQQLVEERQRQKLFREKHNSEYLRVKKEEKKNPPLFMKINEEYEKKSKEQTEKINRTLKERKSLFLPIKIDELSIHEKKYDQERELLEQKREQKVASFLEQHMKSRLKYSYISQNRGNQNDEDKQQKQQKQQAKLRLKRIKDYRDIVRQQFKPKIDENKRQKLFQLIEFSEGKKKKAKKIILKDGTTIYKQLQDVDSKNLGIKYLEKAKSLAIKKRKNSEDSFAQVSNKKQKNYLQQLHEQRKNNLINQNNFVQRKHLTYREKIQKVHQESAKLHLIAEQNQMKLRYGKFNTSEQILACKEEVDHNYLEIARMKLNLIKNN